MALRQSPYAKMYLVSPAIYGKLLSCLDERDKAMAESLNPDRPNDPEEKRPSEKLLEEMHEAEINPKIVVDQPHQFITPEALQEGLAQVMPTPSSTHVQPVDVEATQPSTQALVIPDYDQPSRPSVLQMNPRSLKITKKKKGKNLPILPMSAYEDLPLEQLQRRRKYPGWFSAMNPEPEGVYPTENVPPITPQQSAIIPQVSREVVIKPEIARDPTNIPRQRIIMPEIMRAPDVRASLPNCVTTKRGTICNVATTGRISKAGERFICEYCGTSVGRKWDFKKHLLNKHGVQPEPSYGRWGINDPDAPQGVKRTQSTAGIVNRNPTKVSRIVEEPGQSGSGSYPFWK